jgi:hypothetical protein
LFIYAENSEVFSMMSPVSSMLFSVKSSFTIFSFLGSNLITGKKEAWFLEKMFLDSLFI